MAGKKVRFGIVGIGGYSKTHIDNILKIAENDPDVGIAAAVVRNKAKYPEESARLEAMGVNLVPTLDMLFDKAAVDLVCVPTGIDTHVPFTTAALDAGFPVLMEKPVSGSVDDAFKLIAAQKGAGLPVLVGYQRMYEPFVYEMKRKLLEGIVGRIREIRCLVLWQRDTKYYNRNPWAGELKVGDTWVLDCPFNNACAHYLMESLFFAGATEKEAADPVRMRAELYRASPISSVDTGVLDIETDTGARVLFLTSHVTTSNAGPHMIIKGDHGEITFSLESYTLSKDGEIVTVANSTKKEKAGPFVAAVELVRTGSPEMMCDLETGAKQTIAANGAFMSATIKPVPAQEILQQEKTAADGSKSVQYHVKGLFEALNRCFKEGTLPSDGLLDWADVGGWVDVSGLKHFPCPI